MIKEKRSQTDGNVSKRRDQKETRPGQLFLQRNQTEVSELKV